uniref:glutamate--tRNA ligase n=1 Tax=Prymnesium polylepis TaxID=72548 RepID=A0A7S4HK72_9EUKA
MGASKNTNLMEWDKIWATNKAEIDGTAGRYTALLSDGLVPVTLLGAPPEVVGQALYLHPKDESLGKKVRLYSPTVLLQADDAAGLAAGEEVTLMSWGNVIVREVRKDAPGGKVASIVAELHLEGSVKATKKKLTWLASTPDLVDVKLVDFDFLLNKDKVEEDDAIEQLLTPVTRFDDAAKGEASLRQLQKGQIIQVERRGYYICDEPYVRPSDPIVLFFVPDGKNMFGVKR